jgi:hypothetical protein
MALMSSARNRTLERFHPDRNRVRVQPFSSGPGLSEPPVVARAGIGGPDKPGHDEVEGWPQISSK